MTKVAEYFMQLLNGRLAMGVEIEFFRSVRWQNFRVLAGATVQNFDTLGRFRKANETAQALFALAGSVAIEILPSKLHA